MGASDETRDSGDGRSMPPAPNGAAKTTSFSASIRKLLPPIGATLLASVFNLPIYITAIPYLLVNSRFIQSEPGETSLQWWTKFAILQFFFSGLLLVASVGVLSPVFGFTITGYHALALFIPTVTISLHDRTQQYGFLGTLVVQNFFDVPLLAAGYVAREVFGLRLLAPFCNILDDTIVQGSLPFPSDIATLAAEPYNVGLIVNMCREYKGATHQMKEHGIVQCYQPHQDTTAVSYESLVAGCQYIRQFRKHNPNKRVYVHCKGGIARASTMVLAHYVRNEGKDPSVAIREMKAKRHVVYSGVRDYPAIVRLNEERESQQSKPKSS